MDPSWHQAGVAIEQVNQFKDAWMRHAYRYTKEYTSIFAGQLVDLLKELPPPLGIGADGSYFDCQVLAKKVWTPRITETIQWLQLRACSASLISSYGN